MTAYTLMSGVPFSQDLAGTPVPARTTVSVSPAPTRASFTLTLTGPANSYGQATVLGSADGGNTFEPLFVVQVSSTGPLTETEAYQMPMNIYTQFQADLNNISSGASAALTMTV